MEEKKKKKNCVEEEEKGGSYQIRSKQIGGKEREEKGSIRGAGAPVVSKPKQIDDALLKQGAEVGRFVDWPTD